MSEPREFIFHCEIDGPTIELIWSDNFDDSKPFPFQEDQEISLVEYSEYEKVCQERDRYKAALERLASSEAFHIPTVMNEEEKKRIKFAKEALVTKVTYEHGVASVSKEAIVEKSTEILSNAMNGIVTPITTDRQESVK